MFVCCGCAKTNNIHTITIFHTSDIHDHLSMNPEGRGGLANIAAYIKETKKKQPGVFVVDSGDMTQGTLFSEICFGEKPVFEVMNAVGYDCAALGNHEFGNGVDYIKSFREVARFPLLSANVYLDGELVADAPVGLFNVDGVKVEVIGITTSDDLPEGLTVSSPEKAVEKYVPALDEKADIIVALTHLGTEEDKNLAAKYSQINVICGGHDHAALKDPIKVNNTLIIHSGYYGGYLGRLELKIDLKSKKILESKYELIDIPVKNLADDVETKRVIDKWEHKVAQFDFKIGSNPEYLSVEQLKKRIESIWQQTYKTDFAYQNLGGTRCSLAAGDIWIHHIYEIMPFDDTLFIMQLSREQIDNVIENPEFNEDKEFYTCITGSENLNCLRKELHVWMYPGESQSLTISQPTAKYRFRGTVKTN